MFEAIAEGAELLHAGRGTRGPGGAREQQNVCQELLEIGGPRRAELLDDLCLVEMVDRRRGKDGRLTADALDFCTEPREVLERLRRLGQHIYGVLDGNGAELLQPAP